MNSFVSRRSASSSPKPSVARAKKNRPQAPRLRRAIDVRRWKKLLAYLEEHGIELDFVQVAQLKGLESGTMVRHIVKGYSAMNELWMLCIAAVCQTVPQAIWGEDWPHPHLTPDPKDPGLAQITHRWTALPASTRQVLVSLASAT